MYDLFLNIASPFHQSLVKQRIQRGNVAVPVKYGSAAIRTTHLPVDELPEPALRHLFSYNCGEGQSKQCQTTSAA